MATRKTNGERPEITRADVLAFRFERHGLHRPPGTTVDADQLALLDQGIQDTGPDGAAWALAVRGVEPGDPPHTPDPDRWAIAWTLRGAPHLYRRTDLADVAVATAPFSEADAAKRIFDAAKPLKAADIAVLDALATVARHQRDIVTKPTVKGDLSTELTGRVDEPFLRYCRPCDATHLYEQPFRLSALQAGLELEPGTSPPVLRRIKRFKAPLFGRPGSDADPRFDVIRNHLRFFGPTRPKDVAGYIDTTVKAVQANWPDDTVEVTIADLDGADSTRQVLAADLDDLVGAADRRGDRQVVLVGPFDPYLQVRDRDVLVPDEARRKALWPVLGRPGAIVADGEIVGTWRPKSSGTKLTVRTELWGRTTKATRGAIGTQAEALAEHRGVTLASVTEE